ncbi:MAG: hypothetical protein CME36_10370 [unclassified Hahellaceae]|nr:hypothetical protein [Hahellaceae bacterium]|tara:strand:+ start:7930 stop:8349 length:420 start_codon:yes stop_codon:yes gene_type:complete
MSEPSLKRLLDSVETIILVGASEKQHRDSYKIMAFLLERGYEVFPVNPRLAGGELMGRPVFASITQAADHIRNQLNKSVDMVDVFRDPAHLGEVAKEAIAAGVRILWGQLGVQNAAAEAEARQAGLTVVTNQCPKIILR